MMKIFQCITTVILSIFVPCILQAADREIELVRVCDDSGEWPPFIHYQSRDADKGVAVVGYSVDVIEAVFAENNIQFSVDLIPWKRCLREVELGEYDMLLNASSNDDRARKYYLSSSYYAVTPYYFYSKKHNPDGLTIRSRADLSKYRVGCIIGYNYDYWGIKTVEVDRDANDYAHLIGKLHRNRVDLFVENMEVIAGFSLIGQNFIDDPDLGYRPFPEALPTPFHMMFTRNERGQKLMRLVNKTLAEMQKSGQLQEFLKKYFP
ncbi:substrate-binding periplasmic protein [Psychromonas ossibalaenae]|uniref:substrate-binding periplasmic protein n=1 Tax=Psychromonas ossibalaenae TaxID=444922 RepID=UPI000379356C|nr:transporter substrate-binding domain-containing protein [Psychromonas ossibalaenae]